MVIIAADRSKKLFTNTLLLDDRIEGSVFWTETARRYLSLVLGRYALAAVTSWNPTSSFDTVLKALGWSLVVHLRWRDRCRGRRFDAMPNRAEWETPPNRHWVFCLRRPECSPLWLYTDWQFLPFSSRWKRRCRARHLSTCYEATAIFLEIRPAAVMMKPVVWRTPVSNISNVGQQVICRSRAIPARHNSSNFRWRHCVCGCSAT